MNQEELELLLNQNNKGVDDAMKTVFRFQKGKFNPIKTSYEFLNNVCLGGLLPNLIISILARPGHGKSWFVQQLRQDILRDKDRDIGVLLFNWEMTWFSLLLVQLKKALNLTYKEILNMTPQGDQMESIKRVVEEFRDPRMTTVEKALTPQQFDTVTRAYIEANIHKEQIFILVDHVGITVGRDKLNTMFELMEVANAIKLDYPNKITFIMLSQLNRSIETLWRTKDLNPLNLRVTSEYVYGADSIMQYSDVVMASVIPQKAGLDKYCTVNIKKYEHLTDAVIAEDRGSAKDYVRLKGSNRVYYDFLKFRLDDNNPSLYCDVIDQDYEDYTNQMTERDYTQQEDITF